MSAESYSHEILSADFEAQLVQASTGKRFANLLIDIVACWIFLFVLAVVFTLCFPGAMREYAQAPQRGESNFFENYAIAYLGFILYFTLTEAALKGKTIGKLVTGTAAVNEADGSRINLATAFYRALCRIVPFEIFSGFGGYPWHDKWTKTLVIDERLSVRN